MSVKKFHQVDTRTILVHFWQLLPRNGIFVRCKIHFASSKSCGLLLAALLMFDRQTDRQTGQDRTDNGPIA